MIIKRIIIAATACVLAFGTVAVSACKNKEDCEHVTNENIYLWETVKPANCSEEGLERGVCQICGDVKERVIPVDHEAHDYGDWTFTMPTNESEGLAVKVCSHDSSHVHEVVLPKLGDTGKYTSVKITTMPTVNTVGAKTYLLSDSEGDITFTVPVGERGIETVADAVLIGSLNGGLIRSGSGTVARGTGELGADVIQTNKSVSYEFGDNYTHILDNDDATERWCTVDDDGEYFFVVKSAGNSIPLTIDTTPIAGFMKGYGYNFTRTGDVWFYGMEDLLSGLYTWGVTNPNGDFEEGIISASGEEDGEEADVTDNIYWFTFGKPNMPTNFGLFRVEFTLTENYSIKTLDVTDITYNNSEFTESGVRYKSFEQDPATGHCTVVEYEKYDVVPDPVTEYHEDGSYTVTSYSKNGSYTVTDYDADGNIIKDIYGTQQKWQYTNFYYIEKLSFTQTEKTDDDVVPESPYKREEVLIQDLTLKSAVGGTISNGDYIENVFTAGTAYYFTVTASPATASLTLDPITLWWLSPTGYKELNVNTMTSSMYGYVESNGSSLMIKCSIAGVNTFMITSESGNLNMEFTIDFAYVAPANTDVNPSVNTYAVTNYESVYNWIKSSGTSASATMYAGNSLQFKMIVAYPDYQNANYSLTFASVPSGANSTNYSYEIVKEVSANEYVTTFTPTVAGTYTIIIRNTMSTAAYCTLNITVLETPDDNLLRYYTYKGQMAAQGIGEVNIEFKGVSELDYSSGTATVTYGNGNTEILTYVYENGVLTTEHSSGYPYLGKNSFSLSFDEQYNLVVSVPTFGSFSESKVFTQIAK